MLSLDLFAAWFTGTELISAEAEGEVLVLKLSPEARSRALSDSQLRETLVAEAKKLGFSRLALDLSS